MGALAGVGTARAVDVQPIASGLDPRVARGTFELRPTGLGAPAGMAWAALSRDAAATTIPGLRVFLGTLTETAEAGRPRAGSGLVTGGVWVNPAAALGALLRPSDDPQAGIYTVPVLGLQMAPYVALSIGAGRTVPQGPSLRLGEAATTAFTYSIGAGLSFALPGAPLYFNIGGTVNDGGRRNPSLSLDPVDRNGFEFTGRLGFGIRY